MRDGEPAGVRDGERGCEWGDGRGAKGEIGGGAKGEIGGGTKGEMAGPLPAEDACNMKKQKDGIASPSSKEFCFSRSYVYETGRPLSAQVTALEENFFF